MGRLAFRDRKLHLPNGFRGDSGRLGKSRGRRFGKWKIRFSKGFWAFQIGFYAFQMDFFAFQMDLSGVAGVDLANGFREENPFGKWVRFDTPIPNSIFGQLHFPFENYL